MSLRDRLVRLLLGRDDAEPPPDAIVPLVDAPDEMTAQLWRDQLRGEGIPAQLVPVGVVAYGMNPARERRLLVRQRDVARAREVLELDVIEAEASESAD